MQMTEIVLTPRPDGHYDLASGQDSLRLEKAIAEAPAFHSWVDRARDWEHLKSLLTLRVMSYGLTGTVPND